MPELIADCPRCGAANTGVIALSHVTVRVEHGWLKTLETFCLCRNCQRTTVFVLRQSQYDDRHNIEQNGLHGFEDSLNNHFEVHGYISQKDRNSAQPPDHLPDAIETAFREGATCLAAECWNAAGVMFRVCVDLATRDLLPPLEEPDGPNSKQRRDLGLRLPWLFDHGGLPEGLRDLSACVHQDGNDGAHQGTLSREDAEDLIDFTQALLERLYTEPRRLAIAAERRAARREPRGG